MMIFWLLLFSQMPSTPEQQILLRAAEIVEQGWCQQDSAQRADGTRTYSYDPTAVRWCALGAVHKAALELGQPLGSTRAAWLLNRRINLRRPVHISINAWNDLPRRQAGQVAQFLREAAQ